MPVTINTNVLVKCQPSFDKDKKAWVDSPELSGAAADDNRKWIEGADELDRIASMILAVAYSGSTSLVKDKQDQINIQCVAVAEAGGRLYIASNGLVFFKNEGGAQEVALPKKKEEDQKKPALVGANKHWEKVGAPAKPTSLEQASAKNITITKNSNSQVVFKFAAHAQVAAILQAAGIQKGLVFPPECQNTSGFHAEMSLITHLSKNNIRLDRKFIGVSKPCCEPCSKELLKRGIDHSFIHAAQHIGGFQAPDTPNPL
jgi:deoxycytidylate deaminase